jgi:hypothetical protein
MSATLPPKFAPETLPPQYAQWIAEHYPTRREAIASCWSATEKMVAAFPELRKVRGYCGGAEHWWCETADGTVVDPTAVQYPGEREYRALDESGEQPTGYCEWCKGHVYAHARYCGDECRELHEADQAETLRDSGMVPDPERPGVWMWPQRRSAR